MRDPSPDHPDIDVTHGDTDNHSAEAPQTLEEENPSGEDHPREAPQEERHLEDHLGEDHPREDPHNQSCYHMHS
jgi:hypothetical protein